MLHDLTFFQLLFILPALWYDDKRGIGIDSTSDKLIWRSGVCIYASFFLFFFLFSLTLIFGPKQVKKIRGEYVFWNLYMRSQFHPFLMLFSLSFFFFLRLSFLFFFKVYSYNLHTYVVFLFC